MIVSRLLYWLLLCCLLPGLSPAVARERPARFQHLTVDDGLPENSVRAIVQDGAGFLWFGTQSGLVRYDGYEMVDRWHSVQDTSRAPRFIVTALQEDAAGHIWIGTMTDGLWRLDPRTETFEQVVRSLAGAQARVPDASMVNGLGRGADGRMWVAWGGHGLSVHGSEGRLVETQTHDPSVPGGLPSSNLTAVFEDQQGNLWVGSGDAGLSLRPAGASTYQHFTHDPDDPNSLPHDQVNAVYQAPDGRIWISTFRGLCTWLPRRGSFRVFDADPDRSIPNGNYLLQMSAAADGGMWVGAAVGLYHFDPMTGQFQLYAHDPSDPRSPVKGPVLSVLRDRSGIVWAGSWHAGLNKLDPRDEKFVFEGHDPDDPDSLDDDALMAILEDARGNLWVGTGSMSSGGSRGGLNMRAPGKNVYERIGFPRSGPQVRVVQSLAESGDGTLWVGTNRGLWRVDGPGSQPVRAYTSEDPDRGIGNVSIRGLVVDTDGILWASAFHHGLYRIDLRTDEVRHYVHDAADSTSLSQNQLIFVHEDRQGRLWAGGDTRGLHLYDPSRDAFQRFHDPHAGLSTLTDMAEDSQGRLWIASFQGLIHFDPHTGRVVETLTTMQGLPHNQIASILVDEQDRLWLSTARGVARFDPESRAVSAYDIRDGLPANEICFAHEAGYDGTFYLGGNHGLIRFRPRDILDRTFAPPVQLTELRIGDVRVLPGHDGPLAEGVAYTQQLQLSYDQNDLTLAFAALDFMHPERNQYRYRLVNFDEHWRRPDEGRRATYTNLEPGDYRFEVEASNSDGVWSGAGAQLELRIAPPWWNTAAARALYAVLGLLVALAIYRQVVQRERMQAALSLRKAEAEQLQDLDRFKSRFFANISHEFRTPLTLIQAPLQRLQQDPSGGERVLFEMMERNAQRLGDLIDQLLDLSRLDAKRLPMRWRHGDWLAFLRTMLSSFDSLARSRNLDLQVQAPADAEPAWYDPDVIEKLVSNLLSNAFRFTPDGGDVRVVVDVSEAGGTARVPAFEAEDAKPAKAPARWLGIEVRNSGSYISPAEQQRIFDRFQQMGGEDARRGGSGIGLSLVKELVDWMHGSIEVRSDRSSGTAFRIAIPLFSEPPILDLEPTPQAVTAEPMPTRPAATVQRPAAAVVEPGPEEADTRPLVLVVEDHGELRQFMTRDLGRDFRVLEAANGTEGLNTALHEIPDLVLSDVMMPGIDGMEMCEKLKKDERTSHIPVVLVTARVETEKKRAGLQTGADDYIAKPFDAEELRIRIANLIEQRRRLAEKYAQRVAGLAPDAMPVTSADERFLARVRDVIQEHLDDVDLDVGTLCREVGLSRAQLHRKLKALTGHSTGEFVRLHRLQRAATLLKGRYGNVTEVAYAVGFQNLSYFARCFREQYHVPPSEFLDSH